MSWDIMEYNGFMQDIRWMYWDIMGYMYIGGYSVYNGIQQTL